jgi:hypothetical protein
MGQRLWQFWKVLLHQHDLRQLRVGDQEILSLSAAEMEAFDPDRHICSIGRTGDQCTDCLPGFGGPFCSECLTNHFGQSCQPCTCTLGSCQDGIEGDGSCRCWEKSGQVDPNCENVSPFGVFKIVLSMSILIIFVVVSGMLCCARRRAPRQVNRVAPLKV